MNTTTKPRRPMHSRHPARVKSRPFYRSPSAPLTEHQPIRRSPDEKLRFIALGGLGEVGRNMSLLEYGDDIIVIDMGLRFPEENMPGIDFIIPNTAYLSERKDKIRGVLLTHGHLDHIGGIPFMIDDLGNPPLYAAPLTRALSLKRHEEFKHLRPLELYEIRSGDKVKLGVFEVEFFHVNHNIPDDLGLRIKTPVGIVVMTSDFKIDLTPINDKPADLEKLKRFGDEGVLLLVSDSTGAEEEGHSISESTIQKNLELLFENAKGRVITATFSSLIMRVQQIITISKKYKRKVIIEGFSMKSNIEIARRLGHIKFDDADIIPVTDADKYPDNRVTLVCTGAQGEERAALMRIANKEHRFIRLKPSDTVIFSSSVIPGNERSVQSLKDTIYRQGAHAYNYKMMDIHAGGHAQKEDLEAMIKFMRPKYFIPVHGNYSMLFMHGEIAESLGILKKNIIIAENGHIVEITPTDIVRSKEMAPANYVMVDGLGIGDVKEVVLRDRQMLAAEGIFVIIATIDSQTGKVRGSPDIISRGFVYLRESKELLFQARLIVKKIVEQGTHNMHPINWDYVKDNLRDQVGEFLFEKTHRRPMVLPVVIEV